jgi:nitrogen fixation/metabolism regulation signal transduction histidine kinase
MSVALSILESLTSGVVAIDREVNIIVFNEAAAHLLGVSRERALGQNLLTIEPLAKLLPFVVRYLTTNGNSTRCSCKSPFALRYRRVKRTFARGSLEWI